MKIGLYTDSHYSSAKITCGCRYNNQSLRKISQAYEHFEKEGCELVICLGDVIDTEPRVELEIQNLAEIAEVIGKSKIPSVYLMGNHDAFVLEREEFYRVLGIKSVDELEICGRRLLFLDACYFKNGRHYVPGDSDWTDCFLPDAEKLKEKLEGCKNDTYLFLHQNIDPAAPANHRLFNADEVFDIINKSGVVRGVFQGHYHSGCRSEHDGVKYVTLPAMCESENAFWVYDI